METYILEGHIPVLCTSIMKWGKWFKDVDRTVAKNTIHDIQVSTVFLGMDHAFDGGTPLLFETMIFGGEYDNDCWRYHTWDEALHGHNKVCRSVGIIA